MSNEDQELRGPDFAQGIDLANLADGAMLLGHVRGEPVLLVRRGDEAFAIGAICTHYGAPLADGLIVGNTVRCPWHHACFDLGSGEALRAPALKPVTHWRVDEAHDRARQFKPDVPHTRIVYVREKLDRPTPRLLSHSADLIRTIVIVGGGAAGNAAAQTLRREGYDGVITLLSADSSAPYDRPNLSKGFLAGTADETSNPLQPDGFYAQHDIDLRLDSRVTTIDVANKFVETEVGARFGYDALLLATGAEPIRLDVPGGDLPHVHYLRTLADCRALLVRALTSKRVVVIGASFIGLEVAASLRARDLDVHVVGRENSLMNKSLGAAVGSYLRTLHEDHGVVFHLGATARSIDAQCVTLTSGETLAADLVVIGIGVRPATSLAQQAGLATDHGVVVNEYLETSIPGIFAAGDIARWPDPLMGTSVRVEHWVVAERLGQAAARNMLGHHQPFGEVPFFWTEQYDFGLAYVGHAEGFDTARVEGSLATHDCQITYQRDGRKLAEAFVHRDLQGLRAEVEFERTMVMHDDATCGRSPHGAADFGRRGTASK